jgi:hypothetical protein
VLVVIGRVLRALDDVQRPLVAGLDVGRDHRERVVVAGAVDADRDHRVPRHSALLRPCRRGARGGELLEDLEVERDA